MHKLLIRLSPLVSHIVWHPEIKWNPPRFNNDSMLSRIGGVKNKLDILGQQNIFRLLIQDVHVLLAIARVRSKHEPSYESTSNEHGEENGIFVRELLAFRKRVRRSS
jgi:hypothetical protein